MTARIKPGKDIHQCRSNTPHSSRSLRPIIVIRSTSVQTSRRLPTQTPGIRKQRLFLGGKLGCSKNIRYPPLAQVTRDTVRSYHASPNVARPTAARMPIYAAGL